MTDSEGRAWQLVEPEDPAYVDHGASVFDQVSGVVYRATITRKGRNPYLSSLQIDAPSGGKIDGRFLASVPAERIADAVAKYLDAKADHDPDAWLILPPGAVKGRGFVPDLDELAQRFRDSKRSDLVAEYTAEHGVSRSTVDRWISKAREAGLIPEATTGRPRKLQTPGGSSARSKERKSSK